MNIFYPGDDNTGATHGDILVNGYGERGRIIGESPRGNAWIILTASDRRRLVFKTTRESMAGAITAVTA